STGAAIRFLRRGAANPHADEAPRILQQQPLGEGLRFLERRTTVYNFFAEVRPAGDDDLEHGGHPPLVSSKRAIPIPVRRCPHPIGWLPGCSMPQSMPPVAVTSFQPCTSPSSFLLCRDCARFVVRAILPIPWFNLPKG